MKDKKKNSFRYMVSRVGLESSLKSACNVISVYTSLCVLRKIKNNLGLEAMLEYQNKCLENIERENPRFKEAFLEVIEEIGIEKLYRSNIK